MKFSWSVEFYKQTYINSSATKSVMENRICRSPCSRCGWTKDNPNSLFTPTTFSHYFSFDCNPQLRKVSVMINRERESYSSCCLQTNNKHLFSFNSFATAQGDFIHSWSIHLPSISGVFRPLQRLGTSYLNSALNSRED